MYTFKNICVYRIGVINIFLKVCTLYARSFVHASVRYIHIYMLHTRAYIYIYIILINTITTPDTYTIFFSFRLMKNRRIIDAVDGVMLVARIFFVNRCRNKV